MRLIIREGLNYIIDLKDRESKAFFKISLLADKIFRLSKRPNGKINKNAFPWLAVDEFINQYDCCYFFIPHITKFIRVLLVSYVY